MAGDRVLRDIATFLKNNTRHNVNPITGKPDRPIDGIYKFGGEEILLLLKNIKITFSTGVVNLPKNVDLPNDDKELANFINNCIEAADVKLYEAKETGRNNVKLEKIYRL